MGIYLLLLFCQNMGELHRGFDQPRRRILGKRNALVILLAVAWCAGPVGASTMQCIPLPLPDGTVWQAFCPGPPSVPEPPLWLLLPPLLLPPPLPEPSLPPFPPFDPLLLLPPLPDFPTGPGLLDLPPLPGPLGEELVLPLTLALDAGPPPSHAPEPASFALIGLGLLAVGIAGRWKRSRSLRRYRTE